ncbi:rubrerythrin family protein [Bovifimicola ammoniilytica]|uniref:rubrerythrin family protein n=1 Tax=Bovifimicola ammoniilytica TaxID=2981720 RepID=UPI000821C657|nr:rubrerythrin family protein [Bovifimicola ammoniilytica]MCU6752490.1 rubrerythrin family protein [Bovifimicola ammoniilytica]SCJ26633.1 Rubrerythrin [uncultured Eubacterium sp.]
MLDIRGTKTEENIEKEICEKAKLSVRLRLYGRQAEKDGYKYIADIFNENADRLEELAMVGYRIINGGVNETRENLNTVAQIFADMEDRNCMYKGYSDDAVNEGLDEIADIFENVVNIETGMAEKFSGLSESMINDRFYRRDGEEKWECMVCGYNKTDKNAPNICPVCGGGRGNFRVR